ncbi:MAG: C40 family peptidase [Chthonomonadales bacterium]
MRVGVLLFFAAMWVCTPAWADSVIVLDLPPTRTAEVPQRHEPARRNIRSIPSRHQVQRSEDVDRTGYAPRSRGERVVGRLGVITRTTFLRGRPSTRSHALTQVHSGTYVALTGETGSWFGILMQDRSTGWAPSSCVKVLEYEVVSTAPDRHSYGPPPVNTSLMAGWQQAVIQEAYRFLGVPYKFGGTSPTGLDCSAFVQHCFKVLGIDLPRTAHEQALVGVPVSEDQLQAADRLYFAGRDGRITHTGIYIGNGYFIHASSRNGAVAISRLSDPLYQRMFAGARR